MKFYVEKYIIPYGSDFDNQSADLAERLQAFIKGHRQTPKSIKSNTNQLDPGGLDFEKARNLAVEEAMRLEQGETRIVILLYAFNDYTLRHADYLLPKNKEAHHIPLEEPGESLDEASSEISQNTNNQTEYDYLIDRLTTCQFNEYVRGVASEVGNLKKAGSETVETLLPILEQTDGLIHASAEELNEKIQDYLALANTVSGSDGSTAWKALGGAMAVLGVAMVVASVVVLLSVVTFGSAALLGPLMLSAGLGFFAGGTLGAYHGSEPQGLARSMRLFVREEFKPPIVNPEQEDADQQFEQAPAAAVI